LFRFFGLWGGGGWVLGVDEWGKVWQKGHS
jgi:hypothetical protein